MVSIYSFFVKRSVLGAKGRVRVSGVGLQAFRRGLKNALSGF